MEEQGVTRYRGEDLPTVVCRREGEHRLSGGEIRAVRSMTFDGGPKLGVSLCYTGWTDSPPAQGERESNRGQIQHLCRVIFGKKAVF